MKASLKKTVPALATAWNFLAVKAVIAQDFGSKLLKDTGKAAGLQTGSASAADRLPIIVGNLIKIFISLLGVLFLVLIVYGGWLWLTARGDSERVEKAKDTITRAVIGIVIVIGAYTLTSFILSRLITAATG